MTLSLAVAIAVPASAAAKNPDPASAPSSAAERNAPDALERIMKLRVLRVAVPKEFPPFGSMKNGVPEGYDISIARIVADDLDVHLELVPVATSDRLPYLAAGKVDIIIASLGRSAEREKVIDFSMPYAPLYLGVFGRASTMNSKEAPSVAGLNGVRVGVVRGSLELTELKKAAPGVTVVEFGNSKEIVEAYSSGKIDRFAAASPVVDAIPDLEVRDSVKLVGVLKDSPCYIGLPKGEKRLRDRINQTIKQSIASGVLMIDAMIWFKSTAQPGYFKSLSANN